MDGLRVRWVWVGYVLGRCGGLRVMWVWMGYVLGGCGWAVC